MAKKPAISNKRLAALRERHDPALIDALLERADVLDLRAVHRTILERAATGVGGASHGAYDGPALARREHEAEMIRHEVRMFDEIANLMTQITDRYAQLTGVARARDGRNSEGNGSRTGNGNGEAG